jgi:hypothetical protein
LKQEIFMRKSLLTLSLALMLGAAGAAAAVAATQAGTASADMPTLLAQASPRPFVQPLQPARPLPPQRRAPLSEDERASQRAARCEDRADRLAGQLAYLEARLDLTPAQRPAFERWRDVRQAAAQRQARDCANRPGPLGRGAAANPPSPVERMAREEEMLRQRLADLQAQRPALEALYTSLTPEQREKFTVGGPRGMGRGGMRPRMAMMLRDRLIQRGPMMRGGRGMPPGGPAAPPVPPPAQ